MIRRPDGFGAFKFAVLSGLRASQLARGCAPRVPRGHNVAATAQMEVAERKVEAVAAAAPLLPGRAGLS